MRGASIKAVFLGSAVFFASALDAQAAKVKVMGFGGTSNWPIFVAQDKGFFAREGLEIDYSRARNSATQLVSLIEGKIDIAMTSIDNVIAYQEGQGEKPTSVKPDLFAFLGVNKGARFNLIVAPEIKTFADLKGKAFAVDALTTGYAFVLMEMLRRGGLNPGDYKLVSVGGSRHRWEALQEKKAVGALLNPPYDARAEAEGFKRFASSADVIDRYQGSVGAARRQWAAKNEDTLVKYIRAYVAAVDWLYDPANKEEAKAILAKRRKGLKPEAAERSYQQVVHPARGSLSRKAEIDIEGVRAVLKLRSEFARPKKKLTDPHKYYDPRYYKKALRGGRV